MTDAALVLDKALPVASGIGGGSADAAATLRLLARLTGRALPLPDRILRLGADVPVCLAGRPARMTGIGEGLATLPPLPPLAAVLVNPRVPVQTAQVFAALARRDNAMLPDLPLTALASAAAFAAWLTGHSRNDLVAPARQVAPVLAQVQTALEATDDCLLARMSGSGGTHFGLYARQQAAEAARRDACSAASRLVDQSGLHPGLTMAFPGQAGTRPAVHILRPWQGGQSARVLRRPAERAIRPTGCRRSSPRRMGNLPK